MAKFWVNTGHTLYHEGKAIIHAGEEIAEEIVSALKKDMAHFKAMLAAGVIAEEKPQINTATDKGAPSQEVTQMRPVRSTQGQSAEDGGPSSPPVVDAEPPAPGRRRKGTDRCHGQAAHRRADEVA